MPISSLEMPVTTRTAARPTTVTTQSVQSHSPGDSASSARSTYLQDPPSTSPSTSPKLSKNDPSSRSGHKAIEIGLGVSIPIFLILLVTTAVYLWRKKRTPPKRTPNSNSQGEHSPDMQITNIDYRGMGYAPPEMDDPSSYPGQERGELAAASGTMRTEMPGLSAVSELDSRRF